MRRCHVGEKKYGTRIGWDENETKKPELFGWHNEYDRAFI